ncbi:DivIVA domain-containing protein [Actinoplanes sp. NPDC020271]|uniref:DivIVA domain-containing protein n=1 Tax=Actinoplanes sp. NPDC020271 TaxID=3363896 RepID=UPI0037A0DC4D
MPLTPADVHNITFHRAGLGKRGYDADEVDALRDEITQEMLRLLAEREELEQQLHGDRPADPGATAVIAVPGPAPDALAAVSDELDRALVARDHAEQDADELQRRLAEAHHAGPAPAEVNGQVLAMAQRTAEQHMQDAYQESEQMLVDARVQSQRIAEQAAATAHDIEEDALRRDDQAVAQLTERRSALQHEVAELTEFAENYRAGLADDVRHQGDF